MTDNSKHTGAAVEARTAHALFSCRGTVQRAYAKRAEQC
jgi:hypothetical protein